MVGFVERFRKPKLPITLGSSPKDLQAPSLRPTTPQHFSPPVLRNFSYPTNVGSPEQPPQFPSVPPVGQTAWDRLGEICNFSPDSISRTGHTKTLTLDDPFFFKSGEELYSRLDDEIDRFGFSISPEQLFDHESLSQEEPKARKKQRRSDRIFAQNYIVTSCLKRNSLGQHKAAASLDTSRLMLLPSGSPDRPASSSGVPLIDTKVRSPSPATRFGPSLLLPREGTGDFSLDSEEELLILQTTTSMKSLDMDPDHHGKPPYGSSGLVQNVVGDTNSSKRNDLVTEPTKNKAKDGKHRWLSQFKGWVSVSEPSAQALKQYKKETYEKAHIALDDPQANAKLHLPIGTLPPEAIKPAGGPDPEEVAMKQVEQRKKMELSGSRTGGTSQGSRSSISRYSSSSSIAFSAAKETN
ncbi:hypothetical protein F4804DRAFT_350989 [Jackrogersella minutella]|nr:hypothetical protein F4804DRAFT_350989 [Jackrogersella minutella]